MLTFMQPPSSSPTHYLPANPSPLSPRSVNITSPWPRNTDAYMSDKQIQQQDRNQNENESATATPFSKRPIKRAPLQKQDNLKERRRTNFLRNVRDKREDRRYEARGEDIMRLDFVQKRRAYEAELARNAPSDAPEVEEDELPTWSQQGSQVRMSSEQLPEEEVEEFVRDEEGELEALLEFMPNQQEQGTREEEMNVQDDLWSDDADYDALFSEVLGLKEGVQHTTSASGSVAPMDVQHVQQQPHGDDDEMDMS